MSARVHAHTHIHTNEAKVPPNDLLCPGRLETIRFWKTAKSFRDLEFNWTFYWGQNCRNPGPKACFDSIQ